MLASFIQEILNYTIFNHNKYFQLLQDVVPPKEEAARIKNYIDIINSFPSPEFAVKELKQKFFESIGVENPELLKPCYKKTPQQAQQIGKTIFFGVIGLKITLKPCY